MRYIFIVLITLFTGTVAFSQQLNYLNRSVCAPPDMSTHEEENVYMHGGGHNYYLSYTPEEHMGSFSEELFPYGTEQNPMIIYVDKTEEGEEEKYYILNPIEEEVSGFDPTEAFVNSGVWTEDETTDLNAPVQSQGYKWIEQRVFQCVIEQEDNITY